MDWRKRAIGGVLSVLFIVGLAARSEGFSVDDRKTLSLSAKVQTRVTVRLQDAEENGYTYPQDTKAGDLVQHRNLALIEMDHDLRQLTKELGVLYPLKKYNIRAKYHLVGRFMYEGIYDYGPQKFQDIREADRDNIDSFKQQYDLWECYVDLSRGPWFVRMGRQNLAWGETDIFRLLDGINPLDNTFGGPFEDLDDRRIPLWMLRGTYNLGDVGPILSLSLEGFWVPGFLDARVGPWAPFGTPYMVPDPEKEIYGILYVNPPAKKLSNSRWGGRIQGAIGEGMSFSVAHYKTFLDGPTPHFVLTEPVEGPLLDTSLLRIDGDFPSLQITGASMNYWEPVTNTVFRGEVAWFWDEPVVIDGISTLPLHSEVIPLSPEAMDLFAVVLGQDLRSAGVYGIPMNPKSGPIPKKDVLRWMIGFDKQIWVRPLNRSSMFFLSMQYFGQWIQDHDARQVLPTAIPDKFLSRNNSVTGEPIKDFTQFPKVNELESIFTALITTNYRKGSVTPQMAMAYDTRGAWLLLPSVNYIREPFRIGLQYAAVVGNYTGFGLFRDRDQISLTLTYLLN